MSTLQGRIQRLYDATTPGWVDVWGDHLHHGYYGSPPAQNAAPAEIPVDHRQAQVDMIEAVLAFGRRNEDGLVRKVLDAGCGVGGSARHLATVLEAEVLGLTLSPTQKSIADRLSEGRTDVRFSVEDATGTSLDDASFDLIWALESAEHMPSKTDFLRECERLLRPGGRLIMATWCHRPVPPDLSAQEAKKLETISWSYGSSLTWVPLKHYEDILASLSFDDVRTDDWSWSVMPFWSAVLKSVLTLRGLRAIVTGGAPMLTGAYGGIHMRSGLRSQLVRYVVITGRKRSAGP